MKLRLAIPAGIADIASAAIATFMVGVFAVKVLVPDSLGVYAVFFAALIVANQAPGLMLLQPVEVYAVGLPVGDRLGVIGTSLRLALLAPVSACLVALAVSVFVSSLASQSEIVAYAVTFVLAASIAPAQEHLRRMLHIANRSWNAAVASAAQVPAVAGSLIAMNLLDIPSAWIPFGALACGHLAALVVGYGFVRANSALDTANRLPLRGLLHTGRWLLAGGLAPPIGGVVVGILVGRLASPSAVGFAEAARIVGRPLLVFATGLFAVMGPRAMAAGVRRDRASAHRDGAAITTILFVVAVAHTGIVLVGPVSRSLGVWLPTAYEITGLILVVVLANLALSLGWAWRFELIGQGREAQVARTDIAASLVMIAVGFTATHLEAFTIPTALMAFSVVALMGYRHLLNSREGQPRAASGIGRGESR
jgi:O-antigen/teichoic acid export membrane protein